MVCWIVLAMRYHDNVSGTRSGICLLRWDCLGAFYTHTAITVKKVVRVMGFKTKGE